jgi:hypothetical protein
VKIAVLAGTVALVPLAMEHLEPVWESLSGRFSGAAAAWRARDSSRDSSADDRIRLVQMVVRNMDATTIFIGAGLTAGAELVRVETGTYRTVENLLVQVAYECGGLGAILLAVALFYEPGRRRRAEDELGDFGGAEGGWAGPPVPKRIPDLPTALILLQGLVLLPIIPLLPVAAFSLGVLALETCGTSAVHAAGDAELRTGSAA